MVKTTRKATRKSAAKPARRPAARQKEHRFSRRLATLCLVITATLSIGLAGLKKTALNQDFTRQSLSTGDNLSLIAQQVQKAAGNGLTSIPGVSTLISRAITTDTTKALIDAAVTDIYSNTTAAIDFSQLDQAVTNALTSSSTGIGAGLASTITASILPPLHSYLNNQLSQATQEARTDLQEIQTRAEQAVMPLTIVTAICAVWLLLSSGSFRKFLNGLGWTGLWSGLIGLAVPQVAVQLPQTNALAEKAEALAPVVRGYMADVANHLSGYFLIVGGAGILLLVLTATLLRPRRA